MSALNFIPIEEARSAPGLRLVLSPGVPAPWGLSARAVFEIKRIPFVCVAQMAGQDNSDLVAWTGHDNAPVAIYEDDCPRAHWSEQLILAERLSPEPALIPRDQEQRFEMMGLAQEILGEDGLGWNLRNVTLAEVAKQREVPPKMGRKYGSPVPVSEAITRIEMILSSMTRRLEAQAARGSKFLVGDALSAVDLYWMSFSNLIQPMSAELCEMPERYLGLCRIMAPLLNVDLTALIAHRDRIARHNFTLPFTH
jgi:glutathione S-transferase|tara:strand:+ start:2713 stop:3471 length:759 start_codon:yes stop_codon:yes gene_type:complete